MIEVKNLTKRYGDHLAVDGLSFKINNGKIYGLLGPNGAGKSTTMNMMTGCLAPTAGSVKINGFDMFSEPLRAKRCIGYLPELPPVYGDLTPSEFLRFVADAKGVPYNRAIRQVHEAMELTHIEHMQNRLIKNLSKGYRQRVGIASALLGNPDIIILDEPTVGLDPKQIAEIRELIRVLGQTRTVIISSHILSEIEELCDHVLIISKGRLIANSPIEELHNRTADRIRLLLSVRGDERGVLAVLHGFEELESCVLTGNREDGVLNLSLTALATEDLRDRIFFAMADRRYAVLSMEKEEETLESIFLEMTTDEAADSAPMAEADRDGEYELIDEEEKH